MDYEDLVIQLGVGAAGGYSVRVSRSPAGETEAEALSVPVSTEEIDRLAAAFGRAARDVSRSAEPEISARSLAELGDRLFRALLPEAVRNRYHESLGRIADRSDRGLRLRLQSGLGIPAMTRLHAVPWEYLHSTTGQFLALSRQTSIVRHLDLEMAGDRPLASPPLSILVLADGDSNLHLAQELASIRQAWSGQGRVHLTALADLTLDSLREELLARDYHVLHFMGHGGFDSAAGEGSLALRGNDGRRVWVSGSELADQVRDLSSLRLIVLNACWTARTSSSGPYAGVATALLNAGVPAVLAMQFPISDPAALAFSRSFYRRLARGDTIDAAVTEGRMAIRRTDRTSLEWGTPVLFERLTSGRVVAPLRRGPRWQRSSWRRLVAAASGRNNPPSRRARLTWGFGLSVLGVLGGVGAWFWPLPFEPPLPPPKPALYAVRVQVLDPQGRPVSGSTIRASAGNEPHLLPDGWWQIEIPAAKVPASGLVSLWAEHQAWDANRVDLHLAGDANPQAEIRLRQPETWLRGRVVNRRDQAVSGARVSPQDGAPGGAITDSEGRFELKLAVPPGTRVRLRTDHPGSAPGDDFCYAGRDTCTVILESR